MWSGGEPKRRSRSAAIAAALAAGSPACDPWWRHAGRRRHVADREHRGAAGGRACPRGRARRALRRSPPGISSSPETRIGARTGAGHQHRGGDRAAQSLRRPGSPPPGAGRRRSRGRRRAPRRRRWRPGRRRRPGSCSWSRRRGSRVLSVGLVGGRLPGRRLRRCRRRPAARRCRRSRARSPPPRSRRRGRRRRARIAPPTSFSGSGIGAALPRRRRAASVASAPLRRPSPLSPRLPALRPELPR